MSVLREVLASLGIEVEGAEDLATVNQSIGDFVGGLRTAAAALAGGLLVREIGAFITETIEFGDELDKASQRLGMSVGALQEWRYVAGLSGANAGDLSRAFTSLTRNAAAAARGGGAAAGTWRQLGVSVRDSNGQVRSQEAIFADTIRALSGVENHTQRAAMAQTLFGEAGTQLIPLLNQGSEAIDRQRERFAELGGGFSGDVAAQAAAAGDAISDFRLALTSLRGVLSASFLPSFTRFVVAVADSIAVVRRIVSESNILEATLGVLGVALVALGIKWLFAFAIPLAIGALVALGIAAIVLLVEDLITAFEGGTSVIGSFFNELMLLMGSTITFYDVIDGFGMAWDDAFATAREGIASVLEAMVRLQRAIGVEVFSGLEGAAVEARSSASLARLQAGQSRAGFQQRFVTRRAQQSQLGQQSALVTAPEPTVPTVRRERGARRTTVEQRIEAPMQITVDGSDPSRVVPLIERAMNDRLRRVMADAAADLPQAGED